MNLIQDKNGEFIDPFVRRFAKEMEKALRDEIADAGGKKLVEFAEEIDKEIINNLSQD